MPQQPEPAVTVPPALAPSLLRLVLRALLREAREGGGAGVSSDLKVFLRDLERAQHPVDLADSGNAAGLPAIVDPKRWATVAQVAEATGHSERTLRYWAATGRVRAERAGRAWLIDPDSLRSDHVDPNPLQP